MTTTTLLLGLLVTLATASLLAYAGEVTRRRTVSPDARVAMTAFATWWYGASFTVLVGAIHTALGLFGLVDAPLQIVLTFARLVPLTVGLWGLLYYMTYLLTGEKGLLTPVTVTQLAFLVYAVYTYTRLGPWSMEITMWEVRPIGGGNASVLLLLFGIFLSVPVILSAVAYGRLMFIMTEATQRYRIGLVSAAFASWFGTILVGFALDLSTSPLFGLFYQAPGLIASILVLGAYRPPAWVQMRFGVEPVRLGMASTV